MDLDTKYIGVALFLLKKIIGRTFPNPPVVSLVVQSNKNFKENKIINFGFTNIGGRPHAEAEALKGIKYESNLKYTLYSTLEPCCHEGRDESCVSKIIDSKINRVVYSLKDPDKRVNGKGYSFLTNHGLEVIGGVMKSQAGKIYKGYLYNRIYNRPKVTLKIGCSLDSKIAFKENERSNITNKFSNKIVHVLRSEIDAVLIGANTVRVDNPKLTCRVKGLQKFSPIRVILSKKLNFNFSSHIFKNCIENPTIIFTESANIKKVQELEKKKVSVVGIEKNRFKLTTILKHLAKLNIFNLLVEGGSEIFSAFVNQRLVDEVLIFRSNYFVGSEGKDIFTDGYKITNGKDGFLLRRSHQIDDNLLEVFEKKNKLKEK